MSPWSYSGRVLFLSLGWNFFEYGAFHEGGLVWGWLICAAVFFVMGGAPVVLALRSPDARETLVKLPSQLKPFILQILSMAGRGRRGRFLFLRP